MSRPLAIKYDTGGYFAGLQEMSDTWLDYPIYQICKAMAAQPNGTGNLTLNVNGLNGNAIGTFTDTYRPDSVGSHPVGTNVLSVTYTFKQIVNAGTVTPTRAMEWSNSGIRQMSNAELDNQFYAKVATRLAAQKLGSYVLQPAAPTSGTWTQIATITDTVRSGSNTTNLWRKTGESAPSTYRPLKLSADLTEMTDAEIQLMFDDYANYVIATGRGKYTLSEVAPATGTWVKMGSSIADTRNTVVNQAYTGYYSTSGNTYRSASGTLYYSGERLGTFAGTVLLGYTAYYSGYHSALRIRTYRTGATYWGYYPKNYWGYRTSTYASTYYINYVGTYYTSTPKTYSGLTVTNTIENISKTNLWLRTG